PPPGAETFHQALGRIERRAGKRPEPGDEDSGGHHVEPRCASREIRDPLCGRVPTEDRNCSLYWHFARIGRCGPAPAAADPAFDYDRRLYSSCGATCETRMSHSIDFRVLSVNRIGVSSIG